MHCIFFLYERKNIWSPHKCTWFFLIAYKICFRSQQCIP